MLKNKLWVGILLSIFLLIFTMPGFASYYKYTQESGALFYVSTADKADALENHNEVRQILDDLGNLLVHSKRNDLYPKDGSTGGILAIPNSALVSFATGTKGDLFYCSAANVWTKLNIGADNKILVVNVDIPNWEIPSSDLLSDVVSIAMLDENEIITGNWVNTTFPWADNEVADNITCSNYYLKTEIDSQGEMETIWGVALVNDGDLDLYYLKTEIDTQGEMEAIWAVTLCTDTELSTALADYYLKVDINTQAKMETIWGVSLVNDSDLDLYYLKTAIDTQGEMETIWGTLLVNDADLDLYYLKTEIDSQEEMEAIWAVSLANDSELHTVLTIGTASGLSLNVQELSLAINSDTSAGAVTSGSGQNQKVWKTDAAGVPSWRPDEGGVEASTFVALSDTPTFYTDQAHKFPRVNAAEDGMEFYTMPGGGDVIGPATSVDNSIVRFDGTDSKIIQDSLATISDAGSINIPLGQTYKINNVSLSYVDVGAIEDAADTVVSSHVDWGSGADQIDTDDVPEGSSNLYQLTGEEVDDYVYALINDAQSVHTLITITYDDTDNAYDFVVNNDLHAYNWTNVVAGDIPDLSAVYQPLDAALTNISALVYVSPSFIKLTANDTYAVRTLAEVKTDLSLNNVENTALSTWVGTESITTLGTIVTGTWQGTEIADAYIPNDITITETDPTVDTDAEIKAILVDEVTKTGTFTAGRIAKINNATGIIEMGTNTDTEVADAVTKKHTAGTDTTLGTMTADVNMGTHKLTGLSVPSATGQSVRTTATITEANLENAISKKHTQNTDTQFDYYNALGSDHTWSGDKDTQPVGESVVFGDLLYFDWTDKEWKKTDADAVVTVPGERIALESKSDGQACLMLVKGYIRDDSAFEFTASMVYASCTPGAISSTAPTETGDQIQRVGTAKSADILFFNPSIDVGEI